MDKKGVELTINTIIIAVLVVLVLIVVVTFFLGGFGRITEAISRVFFPAITGTDLTIAVQLCEQRCEQAKALPTSLRGTSAFCVSAFQIDKNGNGLADRVGGNDDDKSQSFIKYFCHKGSSSLGTQEDESSLGISCQIDGQTLQC
mgnify:FL=1